MTLELPGRHAVHPFFEVRDDCLTLDGHSLLDLATQVGRTPFYAYVRRYIRERVEQLRSILPREIRLHYAIKANPMPAVVAYVASLVDGLDVASANEMRVALDAGMDPKKVSFAGPGKSNAELAQAAAAGITISVESERELQVLSELARPMSQRPRIAIRVNPDFELKSSGMKMGGGPKQFGIDAERVPEVLAQLAQLPFEFIGLHIFSGSQNLRAEAIVEAQRKSADLAIRLAQHAPATPRLLNLGGGFGIPYFSGDKPLDLAPIASGLHELIPEIRRNMPHAELVLELGRFLVGEAGVYVCRILDRKLSRGHPFLVTDGGLHHHLSASGNFGQVIRKNYPVLIGNRVHGVRREIATVVGPLCTPLDVLADRMDLAAAGPGDLVVILQSGAYGFTASPHRFLGHPPPEEILI